jgi:hypothetical protein
MQLCGGGLAASADAAEVSEIPRPRRERETPVETAEHTGWEGQETIRRTARIGAWSLSVGMVPPSADGRERRRALVLEFKESTCPFPYMTP